MNKSDQPRTDSEANRRYRIGVDIGGTFTDFVMLDTAIRMRCSTRKLLTTPDDPSRAVLMGLAALMKQHRGRPREVST